MASSRALTVSLVFAAAATNAVAATNAANTTNATAATASVSVATTSVCFYENADGTTAYTNCNTAAMTASLCAEHCQTQCAAVCAISNGTLARVAGCAAAAAKKFCTLSDSLALRPQPRGHVPFTHSLRRATQSRAGIGRGSAQFVIFGILY